MITLKSWWLLSGRRLAYYSVAIFLFITVALWLERVEKIPEIAKATIAVLALGVSCYFWNLGSKIAEPQLMQLCPSSVDQSSQRTIYTDTYNESLQVNGDYIQGDKYNIFNSFNFNQGASEAVGEMKNLLKRLEKQMGNGEYIQQQLIQDLAMLARHSSEVRKNLYDWLRVLDITSPTDEIDAAEKLVSVVYRTQHNQVVEPIFQVDKRYRRLAYLLKTAQWHAADDETVRVITKLMPNLSKHKCTGIDVSEISPRALRTINRLWLEASAGRFGFSVQKRIWQRIEVYQKNQYLRLQKSGYDIFVETVGWSNEAGRIYHTDFDYLITNPKGHLPMKILLWETYDPKSNYCYLSNCLFDEFMAREYSNVSFLPNWLREWLLLD